MTYAPVYYGGGSGASAAEIIAAIKADADLGTGAGGAVTNAATAATRPIPTANAISTQIANDQLEGENGWDDGPIVVIAANAATAATEIGKVPRLSTAIAAGASARRTKGAATATTLDETLGATP